MMNASIDKYFGNKTVLHIDLWGRQVENKGKHHKLQQKTKACCTVHRVTTSEDMAAEYLPL
jgi:hypothetical protein